MTRKKHVDDILAPFNMWNSSFHTWNAQSNAWNLAQNKQHNLFTSDQMVKKKFASFVTQTKNFFLA